MTHTSLLDLKINNTPKNFAQLLLNQGDIFWWPPGNFWVITSYDYAKEVLTAPHFTCDRTPFFISRMPNLDLSLIGDFFSVVSKMMVMSDYPQHANRRRICYDGFTNQTLDQLEGLIRQSILKQIEICREKDAIEFVKDFARVIPSSTLAEFFSIPEEKREQFYAWSNNMTQFFGGASKYTNEDGIEVNNSAAKLRQFFQELILERTSQPSNDFLSILLKHKEAFGLDVDEIISQSIMMLVAGQVTTTDQMCNNLFTLLHSPDAKKQLLANPQLIDNALEELNRLDPAVTFIFRVTREDTCIGYQKIKAGDVIFISTHAVNRDPRHFEQPDECSFTRTNNKQISYGYGGHYCLGAKLAKLEMKLCFLEVLRAFPNLRINGDDLPMRKHHSLAFSGFENFLLSVNN